MDLQNTILTHLHGKRKKTPSGWTTVNCPMCITNGQARPDTRSRGGFRFIEGMVYHCFNCGFSTSYKPGRLFGKKLVGLLRGIGLPDSEVKKLQLLAIREKENFKDEIEKPKPKISWREVQLPKGSKPLVEIIKNDNPPDDAVWVYKHIIDRGLDHSNDFYWCNDTYLDLNRRFIVPFYYNGNTVGYTSRIIDNNPDKPKYFTNSQPNYMYNLDVLSKKRKYLIVVEGVLDALSIDGLAVLHNKLNQQQIDIINQFEGEIIVCPDRDRAGTTLIDQAVENGWAVSFPPWHESIKDCADAVKSYGQLFTIKSIIENRVNNKVKINVLRKIA
tara:strand:- start:1843 stop:2832 length:990 start_codon:yes stop_codon:yes gene_type:complete